MHVLNHAITSSVFLSMWKVAIVRPVGTPSSPSDFCPISVVSILSKAFERILHDQVLVYVNNRSLLSDFQSGFKRGQSTTTTLVRRVTEDLRSSISKAFDMVNHLLFHHKLGSASYFYTSARDMVSSFLQDRGRGGRG
jgi:hypothetical protein